MIGEAGRGHRRTGRCALLLQHERQRARRHVRTSRLRCRQASTWRDQPENIMGKYVIGWLLGVPAVVLIGIYLVSNVF